MKFLSSFLGCHFAGQPVVPWGREIDGCFLGLPFNKSFKDKRVLYKLSSHTEPSRLEGNFKGAGMKSC